jgi:glutamate synthase (NADPH/NADH) small chain
MPKPVEWDKDYNPDWPYWPSILRTSSSQEEGVERQWSVSTKRFNGRGVQVEHAECCKVEWELDNNGRPVKMKEVPGSVYTMRPEILVFSQTLLFKED